MARRLLLFLVCLVTFAMTAPQSLDAQGSERIRYILRFPKPHTHYVDIEAIFPTSGRRQTELFMAVWTPGSYLVREYARHVEGVAARGPDGGPRAVRKTRKNRWTIDTSGIASVTVTYRVYGREMTVRNNWIEASFAMLNGAPTFLTLADDAKRPHEVRIERPAAWKGIATPLLPAKDQADTFVAEDYDTLVDSPIIVGNPVIRQFQAAGRPHYLVLEGDPSLFDVDRAVADVAKLVAAGGKAMGGRYNYPHYYFLNMITEASGGLEHKNSFLVMASRFTTRTHRAYLDWLGLVAHEYFHNWNGKRLRPVELGPFDYENEVHTTSLWIVEGFTDYYGSLLVRRAGISSRDEYLEDLSSQIEAVQTTPGRVVTSLDMASYDTWIKQYRPDENTANTTVNYYPKGAVIAFLLDARIRNATSGARTLDDAMQLAYARYSGAKGYTTEQFFQAVSEVAGTDLRPWFSRAVFTTEELDYTEALDWFGLRFRPVDAKNARAYLGAGARADAGRLVVTQVRRGTPAIDAGLNVDDEILAIDDIRVRPDAWPSRLEQYRPGDKVRLLVARREKILQLEATLVADPGRPWRLEAVPNPSDLQKQRLATWLGS